MSKTSTLFYNINIFGNLSDSNLIDTEKLLWNDYKEIKKLKEFFKKIESDVSDDVVRRIMEFAKKH